MLHKIVKMKDDWYVKVPYYFSKMDMRRARFDPVSIALFAGGTALSAYSTIQGGNEAEETGKLQQQQLEAKAKGKVAEGLEAGGAKRKEGRELLATQIAQMSTSGGLVGSNLVIAAESARNIEADAITIGTNADTAASDLRTEGLWARYQGQLAKRNSRIAAVAGGMKSAGQMYMMNKSSNKSFTKKNTTWNQQKKAMDNPYYYDK